MLFLQFGIWLAAAYGNVPRLQYSPNALPCNKDNISIAARVAAKVITAEAASFTTLLIPAKAFLKSPIVMSGQKYFDL